MQDYSDEELLAKFRASPDARQNAQLLDELFGRYYSRVAIWCYRFCGTREAAADLSQDVFLKAYRNLDSFRGASKFSTWLYTITRNHCVNEIKARATRPAQNAETLDLEFQDGETPSALKSVERREAVEGMRTLMNGTLDEMEKKVMVMHFAHEVPLDGVTRLLGLTNASGARAYIVSAKRKLNTAIQRLNARHGGAD
jgi:RNA polymerase sigma-70 factor (ECF subfamily)